MMPPQNNHSDMFNKLYIQLIEFYDYVKKYDYDEHNMYLVFGALGSFLVNKIVQDAGSPSIDKVYNFVNNLCDEADNHIEVALSVTFFEHLTDYKKSIIFSREKLNGRALQQFENVLNSPMFSGGTYAK